MALFTDGPASSMEDLTAQDSQLQNVANVEGIDVTQKLALAQDELTMELQTLLDRTRSTFQASWFQPQADITNVVVTPALKLWHTFRTLEMVYADAYNSQLNDRYAGKRNQFHGQAAWACEKLVQIGVGLAASPVACALAPRLVPTGGGLPDNTYYVTMAWTNAAGEEGAPAVASAIATTASSFFVQPAAPPKNAVGWNVYAGTDPATLEMQNPSPIAPDHTWFQPDTVTTGLRGPGTGQAPSYFKPVPRVIPRG